jgi:hypothetical protein
MSEAGVGDEVDGLLRSAVWDAVWRSVDAKVYDEAISAVRAVVERNVDDAVWFAVGVAVWEALNAE